MQASRIIKQFDEVNSMNAVTPEEQWRKGMMLQKIDRDLKKLRKHL